MTSTAEKRDDGIVTPEAYLEAEEKSERKSEFLAGRLLAMTGASLLHNLIVLNLASELRSALRGGPCTALSSDMRVKVSENNAFFYPDVLAYCGEAEIQAPNTLLNPKMIVEVLSDSTEAYDRGKKFEQYRKIPTLEQYVLASQERAKIEVFTRKGDGFWLFSEVEGLDADLILDSVSARLPLREIYADTELVEDESTPS